MKKRINKESLAMLVMLVVCMGISLHDMVVMLIATITGKMAAWTLFGFITFAVSNYLVYIALEYFENYSDKKRK